jgi:hypothetical protein
MNGIARPDARNHAHGAPGLDLVDVNDACLLEDAQVGRFFGLGNQAAQVGLSTIAQIVLLDCAISKIKQPETQAKLSIGGALDHVMPLENHQKPVRRALVKL